MKRKIALLMALLAVFVIGSAVGQEWVMVGGDAGGNVYYLNVRSIEDRGSYVTAWVMQVFPYDSPATYYQMLYGGTSSYSKILYGFAKERRQTKMFRIVHYDKNDNVVSNTTPDQEPSLQQFGFGQWMYCPPGTASEALWSFAMRTAGIRY